MSTGLLFVTAPEADHKVINRLLLHLKDWEYDSGYRFRLVPSKSTENLTQAALDSDESDEGVGPATPAPVDPNVSNEWAGASVTDIESFCIELEKRDDRAKALQSSLFVVLDADGLRDQTCVLAERVIDYDEEEADEEEDPSDPPEEFNKTRTPWYQTYLRWCNLDIANLSWDEMVEEGQGDGEKGDRWWAFNTDDSGEYLSDESKDLRDKEIEKLQIQDKA